MSRRLFGSLKAKLLGVVLGTTLFAVVFALLAMVAYDLRSYHTTWLGDMSTQAELLGRITAPALSFDDERTARDNLVLLRLRPQVRAAAIYNAHGELFARYAARPADNSFPPKPGAEGLEVHTRDLIVVHHVMEQGERIGTVYLRADYELYDRIVNYSGIALAVAVMAMLAAFGLSAWLQRIVSRPVLAITRVAREVVEQRDHGVRVEKLSDDEVGVLADAFNDLLAETERRVAEAQAALEATAREVSERRLAQDEVMRLNLQLEKRVSERTAQLEASNRELAQATEVAEKANRAKSDFLSSMSHELRTPLNAILGFAQLLANESYVATPEKRREFASHILKAGSHLLTLINEILDLARIESSNLMLSLEPVALAELFAECEVMVESACEARHIRLLLPQAEGISVKADRTRLKQVLLNLLSNAVKYNRDGGAVVVECLAAESPERVRIAVRDTGSGLTAAQLATLFQPFNRLGQEAGKEEGTGIGLVVTKRLVELMGGQIGVSSTPGTGSVFWIELRAAVAVEPEAAATQPGELVELPPARSRDGGLPTLLHIEDNPANLRLIDEILRARADVQPLSATDARLGLELARVHQPQVILMDINLPGLSGNEALAVLRHDPLTAQIPVIAVTANAMPRDIAQGMAAGFFSYITKPINVHDLHAAIDGALAFAARMK
jgi:signal transduction histidine kinase/ActR/RegA family two-component response regulator